MKTKTEHPNTIAGLSGEALGKAMVELRFDTMADVIGFLADQLSAQSKEFDDIGRVNSATELRSSASLLRQSATHLDEVWKIAEKYTVTDQDLDLLDLEK